MSKCKPEDVNGWAVEEYAIVLHGTFASSIPWNDLPEDVRVGRRTQARRAIADGAEPEGWRWQYDLGPAFVGGPVGWVLIRKFKPAVPKQPTLEDRQRETDAARLDLCGASTQLSRYIDAAVVELRALAAEVRK